MNKRFIGLLGCLLAFTTNAVPQPTQFLLEKWQPTQLQFSQNGKRLLAVFSVRPDTPGEKPGMALASWDVDSGRQLSRVLQPEGEAAGHSRILFSPDGRLYCVLPILGTQPNAIVRETATGKQVCKLDNANEIMFPQRFSADGKLMVGSIQWGKSGFWNIRNGKIVSLFERTGEHEQFSTALFSADNRRVVRIGWNSNEQEQMQPWVAIFDRRTGKRLKAFFIERKKLSGYELSPDGQLLIGIPELAGNKEWPLQVPLWNTQSGTLLHLLTIKPDFLTFFRLHFSADSKQLTAFTSIWHRFYMYRTSGPPFARQVWSTASGQELSRTPLPFENTYYSNGIRPTPTLSTTNDRLYARFTPENNIQLYSLASGELVREMGKPRQEPVVGKE